MLDLEQHREGFPFIAHIVFYAGVMRVGVSCSIDVVTLGSAKYELMEVRVSHIDDDITMLMAMPASFLARTDPPNGDPGKLVIDENLATCLLSGSNICLVPLQLGKRLAHLLSPIPSDAE